MGSVPYLVPVWLSLVAAIAVGVYNLRRLDQPCARPLLVMAALVGLWSLSFSLELLSFDLSAMRFIEQFQFLEGGLGATVLWYVLEYIQPDRRLRQKHLLLLFALPAAAFILSLTNFAHQLFFRGPFVAHLGPLSLLGYESRIMTWVDGAIGVAFYLAAVSFLISHILRIPHIYRGQAWWAVGAVIFPGMIGLVFLFEIAPYYMGDFIVVGLAIGAVFLNWIAYQAGIAGLMPFAHDLLYRQIDQIAVVLDRDRRIIEINPAGQRAFGEAARWAIGDTLTSLLPEAEQAIHSGKIQIGDRFFLSNWSPIQNLQGHPYGWLVLFYDSTEQLRLNAALTSSEARYRSLTEAASDAIVIIQNGKLVYANQRCLEMSAYTYDELMGQPFLNFLRPEDHEQVMQGYLRRLSGLPSGRLAESALRTKDGTWLSLEYNTGLIDYQGRPAVVAYLRDITSRKQAEAEVRRLSVAVEQNPAMIVITDPDGRVDYVNPKYCEVTGYAPADVLGKKVRLFDADEKWKEKVNTLWLTLRPGMTWKGEYKNLKKCGEWFWAETLVSPIVNEQNEISQYLVIQEDITRRMEMEQKLRDSEELYRSIITVSPDDISITDLEGRIQLVSPAGLRMFAYTPEDILEGRSLTEFLAPADRCRFSQDIDRLVHGMAAGIFEYHGLRKDGSQFEFEANSDVLLDTDGRPKSLVFVVRDITERKRVEASERQRIQELEVLRATLQDISAELELPRLLRAIVERMVGLMHVRDSELAMFHEDTQQLEIVVSYLKEKDYTGTFMRLGEGCMGLVAQTRQSMVVDDYAEWEGRSPQYLATHTSIVAVPLISGTRLLGVLAVGDEASQRKFTNNDLGLLEMFAQQAVIAIQNAELFSEVQRLATIDPLTGILNRRSFFEHAMQEFTRARRYHSPLSLIMLDLDHFKKINDTFGHLIGDKALSEISRTCASQIRSSDFVGRYGGEEFVVLLPETNLAGAMSIAQRLCETIREVAIESRQGLVKVTASVGVAELMEDYANLDVLLEYADAALYRAKQAGRNRIST